MRVPTARFVEWQHPDVKAVLRAEAPAAGRRHAGADPPRFSVSVFRFRVSSARRCCLCRVQWCDRHACCARRCASLYRLLPLTVSSRVIASDEVGAERARRDGTLSPQQRALLGDSYVPRTERKSRAHADDASAGSQPADQPLRRRSSVADARFGAGRSADKRDCVAPMFVGIGPLTAACVCARWQGHRYIFRRA